MFLIAALLASSVAAMAEDPQLFLDNFRHLYPSFLAECDQSLRECGDYSKADICRFPGVPILLFEGDAVFR